MLVVEFTAIFVLSLSLSLFMLLLLSAIDVAFGDVVVAIVEDDAS